jgi:cytochrome c oxidase subunit 2
MKTAIWLFIVMVLAACSTATATPPTIADNQQVDLAAQGRALFRDKGCVTCHVNLRVEGGSEPVYVGFKAPNLTDYTNDPDFLRRWLSDPSAVRPGTDMPNLRLSQTEIENLIAFLNEPR